MKTKHICVFIVLALTAALIICNPLFAAEEETENTAQGLYGTDMYDISIDNWGPIVGTSTYLPYQYQQWEIHSMLGTPEYTTEGESDLYVFSYGILYIYYDSWGDSALVISLPNTL